MMFLFIPDKQARWDGDEGKVLETSQVSKKQTDKQQKTWAVPESKGPPSSSGWMRNNEKTIRFIYFLKTVCHSIRNTGTPNTPNIYYPINSCKYKSRASVFFTHSSHTRKCLSAAPIPGHRRPFLFFFLFPSTRWWLDIYTTRRPDVRSLPALVWMSRPHMDCVK